MYDLYKDYIAYVTLSTSGTIGVWYKYYIAYVTLSTSGTIGVWYK